MKLIYDRDFLSFELIKDGHTLAEGGHIQMVNFIRETDIIELSDFFLAIREMDKTGHNMSEFGIFGTFIFTMAG